MRQRKEKTLSLHPSMQLHKCSSHAGVLQTLGEPSRHSYFAGSRVFLRSSSFSFFVLIWWDSEIRILEAVLSFTFNVYQSSSHTGAVMSFSSKVGFLFVRSPPAKPVLETKNKNGQILQSFKKITYTCSRRRNC